MYFADISIVNLEVREAYAHVYHLVSYVSVVPTKTLNKLHQFIVFYS